MNLRKEWYEQELQKNEEAIVHRPLEEEYSFYRAVSSGDMEFVQENCRQDTFTNPDGMGILSTNYLTNLKYHFVITVAMITRKCVLSGMELEQAYRLSDFYILKADKCSSVEALSQLHHSMALDFTGKMALVKKSPAISKPIVICMDFIYSHLNTRITVQVLSDYTGLSPSYLSRLFKKELGISISDYILEKKIEKSENLLKYSDYSLVDIANYLAFSSQSHFIQTFKKAVGVTPNKYRNQYYHASW